MIPAATGLCRDSRANTDQTRRPLRVQAASTLRDDPWAWLDAAALAGTVAAGMLLLARQLSG